MDGLLKTDELRILKTPPQSPLCNAYAECHVREIRETLDNLILLGEPHLRRALATHPRDIITPSGRTKESAMLFRSPLVIPRRQGPVKRSSVSRRWAGC